MKIKVLAGKYSVGTGRGLAALENHPEAIEELNSIIEWDKCDWPLDMKGKTEDKVVPINNTYHDKIYDVLAQAKQEGVSISEVQSDIIPGLEALWGKPITPTSDGWWETETTIYPPKTDHLGTPPSLKPGDMFEYNNQTIAVDEEPLTRKPRLILYNSPTGFKALDRIFREHIHPEYVLSGALPKNFNMGIESAEITEPEESLVPIDFGETDLSQYFDSDREESGNLLDMLWRTDKLDPVLWNSVLRRIPELKSDLKGKILSIHCVPNFEPVDLWIDFKGRMVYNLGDLDEEEFSFIYPSLLPDLYVFMKNKYYSSSEKNAEEE